MKYTKLFEDYYPYELMIPSGKKAVLSSYMCRKLDNIKISKSDTVDYESIQFYYIAQVA